MKALIENPCGLFKKIVNRREAVLASGRIDRANKKHKFFKCKKNSTNLKYRHLKNQYLLLYVRFITGKGGTYCSHPPENLCAY